MESSSSDTYCSVEVTAYVSLLGDMVLMVDDFEYMMQYYIIVTENMSKPFYHHSISKFQTACAFV